MRRAAAYEVEGLLRYVLWPETTLARCLAPLVLFALPLAVVLAVSANRAEERLGDQARQGAWEADWATHRFPGFPG